jgi:uncharacterized protein YqeY
MSIEQELRAQLTSAMKAKDQRTVDAIRMINTKIMERRTAKGFTGTVDDALVTDVIQAYKKYLQKALTEFEAVGERGRGAAEQLRWEIAFTERFLPQGLSVEDVRAAVRAAITALGVTDPKAAGRVVGEVMKQHKGRVDAGAVKAVAEEELTKGQ